jgi:hypothetical protein
MSKEKNRSNEEYQLARFDLNFVRGIFSTSKVKKGKRDIFFENHTPEFPQKVNIDQPLTTFDLKVYLCLSILFREQKCPKKDFVYFSSKGLERVLRNSHGSTNLKDIRKSIIKLSDVNIYFTNSWSTKETSCISKTVKIPIITELTIIEGKSEKGQLEFEFSKFKFGDEIKKNIYENYCKPISLSEVRRLKKEISILFYNLLDLKMYKSRFFHKNTKELFKELGLADYKKPSDRKKLLLPVIEELKSAKFLDGVMTEIRLVKTNDNSDYKIICKKRPYTEKELINNLADQNKRLINPEIHERNKKDGGNFTLLSNKEALMEKIGKVYYCKPNSEAAQKNYDEIVKDLEKDPSVRSVEAVAHHRLNSEIKKRNDLEVK